MSEDLGYEVGQAGLFSKAYRDITERLTSEDLKPIAGAFERNCNRVFEISATHVNLIVYTLWLAQADRDIRNAHNISHDHENPGENPEYTAGMEAEWARIKQRQKEDPEYWEKHWNIGSILMQRYITNGILDEERSKGHLSTMIIIGWMAFEALSVDLWKKLVNLYPDPLARNILSGQPPPDSDSPIKEQKTLNLNVLDRFNFDLSRSMGDVLSNQRKVNLESFVGIISAFNTAFGDEFNDSIVKAQDLKWMEAHRNLYAHRGGVVDEIFVRRMRGFETMIPLEAGQNFRVSGIAVRQYMEAVVESGVALIEFADRWLDGKRNGSGSQRNLGLPDPT